MAPEVEQSTDFLAIRHEADGIVDVGRLRVTGRAKGFGGASSAYFNDSEVLAFATDVGRYPLPVGHRVAISGGHQAPTGGDYVEEVGIAVMPVGLLGQLAVVVHLAETWPARLDARGEVRFELLTTYERMRSFGAALGRVIRGEELEARIEAEVLARGGHDAA
jgi:hypothetical protein